ncbi:MAG: class II aldolase/adducin family protein [Bacteroidota bacterium]
MSLELQRVIADLVNVCHRVYDKGFVSATDGNISARLENGNILATPTAMNKGMVSPDDLVIVDPSGKLVSGLKRPSTELQMHLFIYRERPDVQAVVHAHPPYATGFATARIPLTECLFPEVIVGLGGVPLANYATPSTSEVVESIAPFVRKANAILLANHGVVTYGADPLDAYFKMEKVEHAAHITLVARLLGGEKVLSESDIEKLRKISGESYGKDFEMKVACTPSTEEKKDSSLYTEEELRAIVREVMERLGA